MFRDYVIKIMNLLGPRRVQQQCLCVNAWHSTGLWFKQKAKVRDPAESTGIFVASNPHYQVIVIELGSDHLTPRAALHSLIQ